MGKYMKRIDETQQTGHLSRPVPVAPMAPRWAAALGLIAFGVLYAALPDRVTIGPNWLPLPFEVLIFIPLVVSGITKRPLREEITRMLIILSLAIITIALMGGIILYVITLPGKGTG